MLLVFLSLKITLRSSKRTHEVEQNEFVYEVDLIVKENVDRSLIEDVTDNKHLFGGKVQEPLLAFVGIKINKNFIRQKVPC